MLNRTCSLIPTLVCAAALAGCENIVEVDFPAYEPQLVVHSLFSPDQSWDVQVSRSVALGASASQLSEAFIDNASVEILEGEKVVAVPAHQSLGRYIAPGQYPEVGRAYTLRVTAPGYPTVVATDRVPDALTTLDLVFVDSVAVYADQRAAAEMHLHFTDLDPNRNYYELQVWYDFGTGPAPIAFSTNDPVLQGDSFQEFIRHGTSVRYYDVGRFDDAFFEQQTFSTTVRFDRYEANRF